VSHAGARVSLGSDADGGGADGGGAANDGWCFGHVFCHLALFALGSDRVLSTFFFVCSVVLLLFLVGQSRFFKSREFILAAGIMLQAQEASEGVAALKPVSGSAAGKAFDGDDHDSEDQGNEGFDEEEEEEEEDGDAALGSPMKKDAAGRTPRRNSIEFLQVRCSRQCRGCNALDVFFVTKPLCRSICFSIAPRFSGQIAPPYHF